MTDNEPDQPLEPVDQLNALEENRLTVDIQVVTEASPLPSSRQMTQWANLAFLPDRLLPNRLLPVTAAGQNPEVTLRLTDAAEISQINAQYRHKSGPTNVLSFPFEAPAGIPCLLLGDIILCAPVIAREAREAHKPLLHHWAHMIIHGMLHLQGHDHQDPAEAAIMESLEVELLSRLGIPSPYTNPI